MLLQQVRDDEVRVEDPGHRHPAARDLLDDQRVGEERLAETAELLGDHQAEQAHLLHALDDLGRVLVGVLQLGRDRQDLLVDEGPHCGEDVLLDVGQSVGLREAAHAVAPYSSPGGSRRAASSYGLRLLVSIPDGTVGRNVRSPTWDEGSRRVDYYSGPDYNSGHDDDVARSDQGSVLRHSG